MVKRPTMNLYEQQAANRRRTWLVMFAFVAFLSCWASASTPSISARPAASCRWDRCSALGVGSVSAVVSYFTGDRAVLLATGAKAGGRRGGLGERGATRLKLRQLDNVVDEMAIAAGLPRPPVYIVPDADPNAFATGRGPGHASIAVTRGLLDALDRDELQGVVAHEMSHIRNLDVRVMTIVAALVGGGGAARRLGAPRHVVGRRIARAGAAIARAAAAASPA